MQVFMAKRERSARTGSGSAEQPGSTVSAAAASKAIHRVVKENLLSVQGMGGQTAGGCRQKNRGGCNPPPAAFPCPALIFYLLEYYIFAPMSNHLFFRRVPRPENSAPPCCAAQLFSLY